MAGQIFEKIRSVVRQIPLGKVSTYGQVAKLAGLKDAREVGWAMWGNQDKTVPCHRVVARDGSLAKDYSLGGWKEQKLRLLPEGVIFSEEKMVDLDQCMWPVEQINKKKDGRK